MPCASTKIRRIFFSKQPVLKGVGLDEPAKVAELIDNSAYSVEGSVFSTREPHLSIEGDTLQAYFDEDDMLTIQCKSQGVYSSIGRLAIRWGFQRQNQNYHEPDGASFGWSTNAGDICVVAAAAVVTKMPCALSMTYEEHQHFSGKRRPCHSNGRAACDENGKLTAVEFEFGMDQGASHFGGDDVMTKQVRFAFFRTMSQCGRNFAYRNYQSQFRHRLPELWFASGIYVERGADGYVS
jgi:aldehyde oxidoreductase